MKRQRALIGRRWRGVEPALPMLTTLVALFVVSLGALWRDEVIQPALLAVFVAIGVLATLFARETPRRGALFVLILTAVVFGTLYVL